MIKTANLQICCFEKYIYQYLVLNGISIYYSKFVLIIF